MKHLVNRGQPLQQEAVLNVDTVLCKVYYDLDPKVYPLEIFLSYTICYIYGTMSHDTI